MTSTPFELTGVVHLVYPAGFEVHDLEELRLALETVPERSLFHHTAARLLRHPAIAELPPDDFSHWVSGVVQDRQTGERMSFAAESADSPSALRAALVEVLASVSEKSRRSHDAPPGGHLDLLTAASVPVPTGMLANHSGELLELLAGADASVWFYHLIEERWTGEEGPLFVWLRTHDAMQLGAFLEQVARSGRPIEDMRRRLLRRSRLQRLGRRLADAAAATEQERTEAGREAISMLVRRIRPENTP